MKIEFSKSAPADLSLVADLSFEEDLLAERDERHEQWRGHLHSYISVNAGLLVMNVVMAVLSGTVFLWSIFPLIGWGIGLGIHTLKHRAWMVDHADELETAETRLGRITAPKPKPKAKPAQPLRLRSPAKNNPDPWPALLAAARQAVERAKGLVTEVHPAATGAVRDLASGLEHVEKLAEGAKRIRRLLEELSAGGSDGLEQQIQALDIRIGETTDENLREAHLANRALLIARRAKIEALRTDSDRMLAKAQGFLLAVENLHLDAARLSGPEGSDTLSAPIQRLTEEVQILRSVDAELQQMTGRRT